MYWKQLCLFCLILGTLPALSSEPRVKTGIEVLAADDYEPLVGKRIGLVTNPTGVDSRLRSTVDHLAKAKDVKLVALFGPEHGVYGDEYAGAKVGNARDPRTGLPIYSLYGGTRKPTSAMLQDIDVLVLDLQDIGSRSYTYISTMQLCLRACAENHVEFMVLDRPNPLGGERIEGPAHQPNHYSFVNAFEVPYVHGMTMGELAKMEEANLRKAYPNLKRNLLKVVKMRGWNRQMSFEETGLPWVPTSPHIPKPSTAFFYAATGLLGELSSVSIGVGYPLPFETIAAPWIDADDFSRELDARQIPGVQFRPIHYKPFYGAFKGQTVHGIQVHLIDLNKANLVEIQFHAIDALKKLYPSTDLFKRADSTELFDKTCGGPATRRWIQSGKNIQDLFKQWRESAEQFHDARSPYLLYGTGLF
jgi:uncharacterized protein YbbC (DUF1343 family)